ncbi:MAG: hypothetical protein J6U95_07510 [Alistipes sp.]|nr:hypothetical protein [Alistipes sp.]
MKKLILLLAAMVAVSAYAQKAAEAPERKNWDSKQSLYGDVQSLKVVNSTYDFDSGEFYTESEESYKFNSRGDVTEKPDTDGNSGYVALYRYKYDANRNVVERVSCSATGEVYAKYIYKYNSLGKVAEEFYYHSSDLTNYASRRHYLYDTKGLWLGAVDYDSDGYVLSKYDFRYDDQGNRIEETYSRSRYLFEYDGRGNLLGQHVFEDEVLVERAQFIYDDQDRLIEETLMNGNGVVYEHSTKRYNSQNKPIEAALYGEGNTLIGTATVTYDSYGKVIKRIDKYQGEEDIVQSFKYDSSGNLVEHVIDYQEYLQVMAYTYDSHNNLTLKEVFEVYGENTFPTSKTTYEIVYR